MPFTYHELAQDLVRAALMLMVAGFLLYKLRRFMKPMKPTETYGAFVSRTLEEKSKDDAARQTLFGSPAATNAANLINLVLLIGFAWAMTIDYVRWLTTVYLAIGLWLSHRTVRSAEPPNHKRLCWNDRLWFRLFFAWLSPVHAAIDAFKRSGK